MKKIKFLLRIIAALLLLVLMVVTASEVSPIYNFRAPAPFSGEDIFNPYRDLDTAFCWKRANFHTHTRVKGPFPPNECPMWPQETYDSLKGYGYDIVTFSNHDELTRHPFDSSLQVNVYEHGTSPFKFHKLVFGCDRVKYFDVLLPLMASQKQFELDYLGKDSDFIQINHPYRTIGTCRDHFEKNSGYEIVELDTGVSTENEYWDWALSAGHYCFGLANDDLHHPDHQWCIAVRCNFLCTPSGRYEDLKKVLLGGCYYAMRVPDYGGGDWKIKHEGNRHLPFVKDIGLRDSTIYLSLSAKADSIRVNGQDHRTLALEKDSDHIGYVLPACEPYARLSAFFPGGEVIYTNPFAHYDASACPGTPFDKAPQKVNIPLTILYNLLIALLFAAEALLMVKLFRRK